MLDSAKAEIFILLKESSITDKQFIELENARIGYRFMSFMYDYPMYNARLLEYDFVENADYYAFLQTANFNNRKHSSIIEIIQWGNLEVSKNVVELS